MHDEDLFPTLPEVLSLLLELLLLGQLFLVLDLFLILNFEWLKHFK